MLNDERLGWKHAIQPKVALQMIQLIAGFIAFHSALSKTNMRFKMWFLPIPSVNFWFFALLGRGNESRSLVNQKILRFWCLDSSIFSKIEEYISVAKNILIYKRNWT